MIQLHKNKGLSYINFRELYIQYINPKSSVKKSWMVAFIIHKTFIIEFELFHDFFVVLFWTYQVVSSQVEILWLEGNAMIYSKLICKIDSCKTLLSF